MYFTWFWGHSDTHPWWLWAFTCVIPFLKSVICLLTVQLALRNDKNTSTDHLDGKYILPCSYCTTDAIPLRDDQRKLFLPRCWFLPMPSHFLVSLRSPKWWGNTQCSKHNGVLAVYDCTVFSVSGNSTCRYANPTFTWTENISYLKMGHWVKVSEVTPIHMPWFLEPYVLTN